MNKKLAITAGDFNGVGSEIIVKALNKLDLTCDDVVLIGTKELFSGLKKEYEIVEIPFDSSWLQYGKETKESGEFSYKCIIEACKLAKLQKVSAIVTAPVSKNALNLAGHNFSGQTEILEKELADFNNNDRAEMLFVSRDFRVLLLSRHVALKDVKITKELLVDKIQRIDNILKTKFKVNTPKIALCSLNPHAGENGILGTEEIDEFVPAIEILRNKGIDVSDAKPADTLFAKAAKVFLKQEKMPFDVYCACYHDQGLIPIKTLAMDKTVNMTVGLPVIRTSPAHGTAYDIAGKNIADESSMIEAIKQAFLTVD